MSYSDILRVKNIGKKMQKNPFYKSIVKSGLVLWLDGKDFKNSPPTATWLDRSGLGNNAIPSGMAYTTASGSDGAGGVVFDGVDDGAILDNLFNGLSSLTVEVVMDCSNISKANIRPCGKDYSFRFNSSDSVSNNFTFACCTINNAWYSAGTTITTIAPSTGKHQFVGKYDGNYIYIYVDGVLSLKSTVAISGVTPTSVSKFEIGKNGSTFGKQSLYNVRLYNRALTDTEILKNYNASK